MKFYCGIDLSARDCQVCVIDEQLKIVVQQKLRNELAKICQLLGSYKSIGCSTVPLKQSETQSEREAVRESHLPQLATRPE